MDERKNKILNFMKTRVVGVLSTVDLKNSKPESATVAFSETDDLEIIFGTFVTYRKYDYLKLNRNVSFVIGCEVNGISIQYEGVAEEAVGGDAEKCAQIHIKKNPGSEKYRHMKEQRYFKIKPKWIRYMDQSIKPNEVFELNF